MQGRGRRQKAFSVAEKVDNLLKKIRHSDRVEIWSVVKRDKIEEKENERYHRMTNLKNYVTEILYQSFVGPLSDVPDHRWTRRT